jgi:hypothetical protein
VIQVYPDGYIVNLTTVRVANKKAMNMFMLGSTLTANIITILGVGR